MWTFTGYILYKFYECGKNSITLNELAQFMFGFLWKKYNMVLNDSLEELMRELEYISKLGYIDLDREKGEVILKKSLKDFDDVVGHSPLVEMSKLYAEYIYRINSAVKEYNSEACKGTKTNIVV